MTSAEFATALLGWDNVYLLVGGMAATLTGLLFVAVSINITDVMSDKRPGLRGSAIRTFNQFLLLIEISIVMLIPQQSPLTLGIAVAALGLLALVITMLSSRGVMRAQGRRVVSLVTSNVLFIGFVICGVLVIVGGAQTLFVLMSLVIATLISSVFDAWALLVEVGRDMARKETPGTP